MTLEGAEEEIMLYPDFVISRVVLTALHHIKDGASIVLIPALWALYTRLVPYPGRIPGVVHTIVSQPLGMAPDVGTPPSPMECASWRSIAGKLVVFRRIHMESKTGSFSLQTPCRVSRSRRPILHEGFKGVSDDLL